jgi:acyl dehydratase
MPGPGCIYVRQALHFRVPVKAGDTVVGRATVTEIQAERRLPSNSSFVLASVSLLSIGTIQNRAFQADQCRRQIKFQRH